MQSPVVLIAGTLRVRFERVGDRIRHAFFLGGDPTPLLMSLEGESNEAWPASPPFQELTLETRDDRQIAFLVGKAGTSHWSASVEPSAEREEVGFDIACRVHHPPQRLGSQMTVDPAGAALEVIASTEMESRCEVRMENGRIEVIPLAAPARLPATVRWRYVVKCP